MIETKTNLKEMVNERVEYNRFYDFKREEHVTAETVTTPKEIIINNISVPFEIGYEVISNNSIVTNKQNGIVCGHGVKLNKRNKVQIIYKETYILFDEDDNVLEKSTSKVNNILEVDEELNIIN